MNSRKKTLLVIIVITALLGAAAVIHFSKPFPDDFETFIGMREDLTLKLLDADAVGKKVNDYFDGYKLKLNPLFRTMFKTGRLSLYLKSYESDIIDTATISQFEIGEDSGTFFDFTFMIRAQAEYSFPFFHGDALKKLPGVNGAFYMDFYSFENTMDYEEFFGDEIGRIEEALELAEPYWKNEDFGELTTHLDEFKSPYRFEILEPVKVSEAQRAEYFKTVRKCFNLYTEAYLNSLNNHAEEKAQAEASVNTAGINGFVDILYEHDVAVKMGKMLFPEEDFERYFLEGFWGVE